MFIDKYTVSFVIVVALIISNVSTLSLLRKVENSCSKLININRELQDETNKAADYIHELEYTLELCDVNVDDTVGSGDAYNEYYGIH